MNKILLSLIFVIGLFLSFLGLFVSFGGFALLIEHQGEKIPTKLVDCYDRFQNKIIDLKCEEQDTTLESEIGAKIIVGIMSLFFGLIIALNSGEYLFEKEIRK